MGCDGGTIPKRDELVKTKKKPEQVRKDTNPSQNFKICNEMEFLIILAE
jgi:hypothetical protein